MSTKTVTRRQILSASAGFAVVPLLALVPNSVHATDAERLDPDDAQAKALSYVHQSAKAGANCANCRLYTGSSSAEWGPCAIFPGKRVAGAGWCSAWVSKS